MQNVANSWSINAKSDCQVGTETDNATITRCPNKVLIIHLDLWSLSLGLGLLQYMHRSYLRPLFMSHIFTCTGIPLFLTGALPGHTDWCLFFIQIPNGIWKI